MQNPDPRTKIRRPQRVVVYIKDIILLTGRKKGAARRLYAAILRSFEKEPAQFLTVHEFSIYTGIDEEVVQECLQKYGA